MTSKPSKSNTKSKTPKRAPIPSTVKEEVLQRCRRRCCMCFGLHGDLGVKGGQIAHLDRNRANPSSKNLAFLCLPCHATYDQKSNRTLGFTPNEVRHYRDLLHEAIGPEKTELTITLRIRKEQQGEARIAVAKVLEVLREITPEITVGEGPVDSR